jgi:hypothetical protein
MDVEAGSLHLLVFNNKVFRSKQLGELGLDFVADSHTDWFGMTILYEKRGR